MKVEIGIHTSADDAFIFLPSMKFVFIDAKAKEGEQH